jgi:hypothetical protein
MIKNSVRKSNIQIFINSRVVGSICHSVAEGGPRQTGTPKLGGAMVYIKASPSRHHAPLFLPLLLVRAASVCLWSWRSHVLLLHRASLAHGLCSHRSQSSSNGSDPSAAMQGSDERVRRQTPRALRGRRRRRRAVRAGRGGRIGAARVGGDDERGRLVAAGPGVRRLGRAARPPGPSRRGGAVRGAGGRVLQGVRPRLRVATVPQLQVRPAADAARGGPARRRVRGDALHLRGARRGGPNHGAVHERAQPVDRLRGGVHRRDDAPAWKARRARLVPRHGDPRRVGGQPHERARAGAVRPVQPAPGGEGGVRVPRPVHLGGQDVPVRRGRKLPGPAAARGVPPRRRLALRRRVGGRRRDAGRAQHGQRAGATARVRPGGARPQPRGPRHGVLLRRATRGQRGVQGAVRRARRQGAARGQRARPGHQAPRRVPQRVHHGRAPAMACVLLHPRRRGAPARVHQRRRPGHRARHRHLRLPAQEPSSSGGGARGGPARRRPAGQGDGVRVAVAGRGAADGRLGADTRVNLAL